MERGDGEGGGLEAMDKDEDRKLMLPNFRRRSTSNGANRVGGGSARAAAAMVIRTCATNCRSVKVTRAQ